MTYQEKMDHLIPIPFATKSPKTVRFNNIHPLLQYSPPSKGRVFLDVFEKSVAVFRCFPSFCVVIQPKPKTLQRHFVSQDQFEETKHCWLFQSYGQIIALQLEKENRDLENQINWLKAQFELQKQQEAELNQLKQDMQRAEEGVCKRCKSCFAKNSSVFASREPTLKFSRKPLCSSSCKRLHRDVVAASLGCRPRALFQWVSVAVEALVTKLGIPRLQSVANLKPSSAQIPALQKLCAEIELKLPAPAKLTSQSDFPGAPWNKKKTKKEAIPVRASDFTITPGFFQHEDGTPALQLPQLRAQACGVCILDPSQAVDWLKGNNAISSDELGAFILGQLPCETKLPVTPVTAPLPTSWIKPWLPFGVSHSDRDVHPHHRITPPVCRFTAQSLVQQLTRSFVSRVSTNFTWPPRNPQDDLIWISR